MKEYIHKVNYYETDKMGITHHSNYIRFMEEARIDWLTQVGFGFDRMEAEGISSPVLAVEGRFLKATGFPDELVISVKPLKCTGVKLVIGYEMHHGDELVFEGTSTHCFFGADGKPLLIQKQMPDFWAELGL